MISYLDTTTQVIRTGGRPPAPPYYAYLGAWRVSMHAAPVGLEPRIVLWHDTARTHLLAYWEPVAVWSPSQSPVEYDSLALCFATPTPADRAGKEATMQ